MDADPKFPDKSKSTDLKVEIAPPSSQASTPQPKGVATEIAEIGGPSGLEPTRYGDWERGGRCSDF